MRLQDRVTLITGAARGIGRALAARFLDEGGCVVLADRDTAAGADTAHQLDPEGTRALYVRCDVRTRTDLEDAVAASVARFGRLDGAIANAGIALRGDFLAFTPEAFDEVIATNLLGAVWTFQAAGRHLRAQGTGGSLIAMSSINGLLAMPHVGANCVAKGGLNQLVTAAALALADDGIRVNAIAPGSIDAGMVYDVNQRDAAAWRALVARTPLRRMGTPAEVAAVAAFLASDAASYITGQCLVADGGRAALNTVMPPSEEGEDPCV